MSQTLETMTVDGESRNLYPINSEKALEYRKLVDDAFGKQNWAGYISVSNPVYNQAVGSTVVTAVCGVIPQYLYDIGARTAERKFHLDTGFMYDKMYTFAPPLDELPSLPPSAKPIAIGYNHTIAGMAGDKSVESVLDVYFIADPDETEAFFGMDRVRGAVATMYGLTYDKESKDVLRKKVYTYDTESGHYDWENALQIALSTNTARD